MGLFNSFRNFIKNDDYDDEDYYYDDEDYYYDDDEDYEDYDYGYKAENNFFSKFKRKSNNNKTKKRSSLIKGVYEYNDYDPNGNLIKMYCIVRTTLFGKIKYEFTDSALTADAAIGQYYRDMGLDSSETDPHIAYNLSDSKEVFDWIKNNNTTNNEGLDISIEDFATAKFAFEKKYYKSTLKTDSKFAEAEAEASETMTSDSDSATKNSDSDSEAMSSDNDSETEFVDDDNDEYGTKMFYEDDFEDEFDGKKVKRIALRAALASLCAFVAVGAVFAVKKYHGPTSNSSKYATTLDNTDDKDREKDNTTPDEDDKTEEITEEQTTPTEEATVEDEVVETSVVTGSEYDGNYVNTNTTVADNNYSDYQQPATSAPITTTPGSVNDSYVEFQDPNATINDSKEDAQPSTDEEDYDGLIEEETPSIDVGEDNSSEDEDYSEEIEVPVGDNTDDELDNSEEPQLPDSEETPSDEIIFDDEYQNNQGAIDEDYGYDEELGTSENPQLPDPNETASDGDYVSTDTDFEQPSIDVEKPNQDIETVPVEQVVDAAIEAMENGEDVTISVNEDNTVSVEQVPVEQTYEANGMTR